MARLSAHEFVEKAHAARNNPQPRTYPSLCSCWPYLGYIPVWPGIHLLRQKLFISHCIISFPPVFCSIHSNAFSLMALQHRISLAGHRSWCRGAGAAPHPEGTCSFCSSHLHRCSLGDSYGESTALMESSSNSCGNISGVNSPLILLENPCQADTMY